MLAVAAVHLAVQLIHGYSHSAANVENTLRQQLFIVIVITIAPLAAAVIAWRGKTRFAAAVMSTSLLAAFGFGYLYHFVIGSPDLYSNVLGPHSNIFFNSAVNLAIVEFTGFIVSAYVFVSSR